MISTGILRQEHDIRRCADGRVIPREGQRSGLAIDAESGDGIAALIAAIEEISCGINVEAAWVITAGPGFSSEGERARGADGKPRDAVVQPIRGVKELSIRRDHD